MRIIYIDQYFKNRAMIGGSRSYEMARRLCQRGHEVNLLTSDTTGKSGKGWRMTEEDGVRVHWISIPYRNSMPARERFKAFFGFAWQTARYGGRFQADVVFASSTPLTVALPAVRLKRKLAVPMVFEVRDLWPEVPIAMGALRHPLARAAGRWLERFAYRHATRVVALSPGMKDGVCRAGYPADRVSVIPNSADTDLFRVPAERGREWRRQHPEIGDRPMVLYAGTLGRVNGVDWLVRLAAETAKLDPRICYVIVGQGGEAGRVREEAMHWGVLDRQVFLFPPVPKSAVPALLSACSLSASVVINLPELWNNSANKFFDSLAAERPILINHLGWQADLLSESGAGLVLPFGDICQAARLLCNHVTDERWLARAGAAAGRLADSRFARDRLALELENVLLTAVGRA